MAGEFGYTGRILRVDLSSGAITSILTRDYAHRFLGGRGIAAKIHWDEVSPEVKATDPENRLTFITGPLAGVSPGVAGIRWLVCGKSPAANPEQFSYSSLGGNWGTELKFAGYDGIIVQGKSDKPVYISIQDDKVEVRDASTLWGKNAIETRESLKEELGARTKVVAIGPAGENMVVFAIVLADNDAAGTGGFGAVMGSKNLKAIAVRGSGKVAVAQPERLRELSRYIHALLKEPPRKEVAFAWLAASEMGGMATPKKSKLDYCRACGIGCERRVYEAQNGKKLKFECEPLQFYQQRAWRYAQISGEKDWQEVPFHAARLVDEYGVDVNALNVMLGWLSKCTRVGILTEENTGIPFSKRGSLQFMETLLRKLSFRDGFGDILAQGIVRAAELVGKGADKLIGDSMLKSGQNPFYEPRFYIFTALLYAMEPRQPIQQLHEIPNAYRRWLDWVNKDERAYVSPEVLCAIARKFWGSELAVNFSTYEGKALAVTKIQNRQYAKESLVLCDRIWPILSSMHTEDKVGDPGLESKILSAVTGEEVDEQGFLRMGERIVNLQRAIFAREARGTDTISDFNFTTPLAYPYIELAARAPGKNGELFYRKDAVLDRGKFEEMKREFYQLRGWDPDSGLQTKTRLKELELGDVAEELVKRRLAV